MHGQADRAPGVLQAALNGLANPQGGVRGEAKALAPVELLARANQAEHALLDEIAEGQALVLVAPRVGGDEAQVGVDEQFLGVQVAALDALGQVDLLVRRQQGVAARVRKQLVDCLGDERVGHAEVDALDWAVQPVRRSRGRAVDDGLRLALCACGGEPRSRSEVSVVTGESDMWPF